MTNKTTTGPQPYGVWIETRIQDLARAINGRIQEGSYGTGHIDPLIMWTTELLDKLNEIKKRKGEIKNYEPKTSKDGQARI